MNFQAVDTFLDRLTEVYGIPNYDCSVYYRHKEVFRKRDGFTDQARKRPVTEDDLYYLYSASKISLAVAVMQLVERGTLRLSDSVAKYLPEYGRMQVRQGEGTVACQHQATIEDLLSMRGGLNYHCLFPGMRPDLEELLRENPRITTQEYIRAFLNTALDFEPGTHFLYSMCLDVLAAVVEIVTGQRYETYVRENIAEPLGMKTFAMHPEEVDRTRMVQQYDYDLSAQNSLTQPLLVPFDPAYNVAVFSPEYDSSGGGVITRVSDYVLLADALANDGVGANGCRILSRASIDDMRTNRLTTPEMLREHAWKMQDYGYGYGLGVRTMVDPRASKSPVGEFGWDGRGGAFFLSDADNGISFLYLMSVTSMANIKQLVHHPLRDLIYEALADEMGG